MIRVSAEQRSLIEERWGLNDPPAQRLFTWGQALLQGDLGTSMIYRQPVADIIQERFLNSVALMAVAWILSGLIGFSLGVVAAMKRESMLDRLICWYCYTLASTPVFWMALLLLMVFGVWLGWLPIGLGFPQDGSRSGHMDRSSYSYGSSCINPESDRCRSHCSAYPPEAAGCAGLGLHTLRQS